MSRQWQWQWRQFGLASVMAVAAFVLMTGCGTNGPNPSEADEPGRGPVAVDGYLVDGATVNLTVVSCHGSPKAEVTESDQDVRVAVISAIAPVGDACLDSLEIVLAAPLGERAIIDEVNGQEILAPN